MKTAEITKTALAERFLELSGGTTVQKFFIRYDNGSVESGYCSSSRELRNPFGHSPYGFYDVAFSAGEDVSSSWYEEEDIEILKSVDGDVERFLLEIDISDVFTEKDFE